MLIRLEKEGTTLWLTVNIERYWATGPKHVRNGITADIISSITVSDSQNLKCDRITPANGPASRKPVATCHFR